MESKTLKTSILELRKQGKSINQISKELSCAISTVSYHLAKNGVGGVHENFKHKKMSDETFIKSINNEIVDKVAFLKTNGKTYKEIFNEVKISYDKILRICRVLKINIPIRTIKAKNIDIEEIKNLYEKLGNIKKVAKKLGIGYRTARKYVEIKKPKTEIERKKSMVNHVHNFRKNRKIELVNYKGGCCERCGYNKSINALQFHHINPEEKDFSISGKNYSLEKVKKELDKCILVCANCHIEIHEELYKNGKQS